MFTSTRFLGAALCCLLASCDSFGDDASHWEPETDGGGKEDSADERGAGPRSLNESGTRIRARIGSTSDGAQQFVGWRDTELDLDCAFSDPGDGVLRCLPSDVVAARTLYANSSCTDPVARVSEGCGPAPAFIAMHGLSCATPRYYARGSEVTGTIYSDDGNGECDTYPFSIGLDFYRLGAELPLSAFQVMTVSVE